VDDVDDGDNDDDDDLIGRDDYPPALNMAYDSDSSSDEDSDDESFTSDDGDPDLDEALVYDFDHDLNLDDDQSYDSKSGADESRSEARNSRSASARADATSTTRAGRVSRPPRGLVEDYVNVQTDGAAPLDDDPGQVRQTTAAPGVDPEQVKQAIEDRTKEIAEERHERLFCAEDLAVNLYYGKPLPDFSAQPSGHVEFQQRMRNLTNEHTTFCQTQLGVNSTIFARDDEASILSEDGTAVITHFVMNQLSMKAAVKKHGHAAEEAVGKELLQMHHKDVYRPVHGTSLSSEDRRHRTVEAIMTVKEKMEGTKLKKLKGRFCADGRAQRGTMTKDETTSPTVHIDSVFLTSAIDAHEGRKTAVIDLPGAYLIVNMEERGEDDVYMILRGKVAELMVETAPDVYRDYLTYDSRGNAVLYVKLKRALYGLIKSALLFYQELMSDLTAQGFVVNPYDPCVANKTVDGTQLTVRWHVDDLMLSHLKDEALTEVIDWFKAKYGNLSISRGDRHTYLGMQFDFSAKGKAAISMGPYEEAIIEDFPEELEGYSEYPAAANLFEVRPDNERVLLSEERAQIFHSTVA